MSRLPSLHFTTAGQPGDEAFETWRHLMAPMYGIEPNSRAGRHPGGGTTAYLLGDLLANRTLFTAQRVTRDRRRVATTPDHVLFQLWRTGGYVGEVAGRPVAFGAGTVALSDRRRTLDGRFAPADTVGIVVPRGLLTGIDLEALGPRLDPARNRLLTARIIALYRQLPHTELADVPALRAELVAFLRRVLDPSPAADVLEGRELDRGLLTLVQRSILTEMSHRDLTPEVIAEKVGISRSTLYRLFASLGGVMHHVQEQRLLAIRDALADPLETRTLTQLAADHGVASLPHLSRSFRARFDVTPRAWRAHHRDLAQKAGQQTPEPFWRWFSSLGNGG